MNNSGLLCNNNNNNNVILYLHVANTNNGSKKWLYIGLFSGEIRGQMWHGIYVSACQSDRNPWNNFFLPFSSVFDRGSEDWQESRGNERGRDMQHRAAGRTRTQAGRSQPYGMWSPTQRTELNWHPLKVDLIFFHSLFLFVEADLVKSQGQPLWKRKM